MEINKLAFDYGASSGRLMLCRYDGEKITLEEIHRFSNEPVWLKNKYYWDFLRLFHELKTGLKKAAIKGIKISSIGIDTWGVDYGLLDKDDNLLSNPYHYRDSRTDTSLNEIEKNISFEEIYKTTGIQYLQFNTLYQLYADCKDRPDILKLAKTLLFIPDLFSFYLTGEKYNEYSIASTGQLLDAEKKTWAEDILNKVGVPKDILQNIIMPGQVYGKLTKGVQEEVGLGDIPVIAVGSHDTASAVAGTPFKEEDGVFLSCGTWSLLGMEIKKPLINDLTLKYAFTNEGGVEGTIRLLKNINGTWILQQLKKSICENIRKIDFPEIIKLASESKLINECIDPNDKDFNAPLNMMEAIKGYCRREGIGDLTEIGDIARVVYNGLTKEYKNTVNALEAITGKNIETINMVGGGIQDQFLCQLTANTTGKKVVTGPIEASVLGNAVMQLLATGDISSLEEGRKVIRRSFDQKEYIPQ